MAGFRVQRFVSEGTPRWRELEAILGRLDARGVRAMDLEEARRFVQLYRAISSDLIRARTELVDASLVDHLNDLVARAYTHLHTTTGHRWRGLTALVLREFPRLFRREIRAIGLAALFLFGGAAIGAAATAIDPQALGVLVPEQHQEQTPEERVAGEEQTGGLQDGGQSTAFSSWLFTHNIQVSIYAFALGVTFGFGTAAILFFNGLPLGALAVQYHLAGKGLFFWAWILPHGIPELSVICIAGGAGFVLARGLWMPGPQRRTDALAGEAKTAVRLLVGSMPLLVLAGVVEGTISQIHEPTIPYQLKLAFALVLGSAVYGYLLFGGRRSRNPTTSEAAAA